MRKSFLFLADGFEEVEALGVVDVLRRGTIEVKTVSISDKKARMEFLWWPIFC